MANLASTMPGIDYEETSALTKKWVSIRILFTLAMKNRWKFNKMDVNIVFLNKNLKENVFMSHLDNFVMKGQEKKLC